MSGIAVNMVFERGENRLQVTRNGERIALVTVYESVIENEALVIQIDAEADMGTTRIYVNDGLVFDQDPEGD